MLARAFETTTVTLVGCLFLAAGGSKLVRPRAVRRTVQAYRLIPLRYVAVVGSLLGPVEAATGVSLLLSLLLGDPRPFLLLAAAEMSLFAGAVLSALGRGIRIPCGCGPVIGDHVISPATVVRNLCLLVLLVATLFLYAGRP